MPDDPLSQPLPSRRQVILAALVSRLSAIAIADGFNTDAGAQVFLGDSPDLGPDDPASAIAIVVGDDATNVQGLKFLIRLPIEIQAIGRIDVADAWTTIEALLADIKRAVEIEDRALAGSQLERGTTRTLPRKPGSLTVGAGVTYPCTYQEGWGNP